MIIINSENSKSKTKKEFKLTTFDNPFSPFTQFDEWYAYDTANGYDTLGLLGRMTLSSNQLSIEDQVRIAEDAMISIVKMLPDTYRIVLEEDY